MSQLPVPDAEHQHHAHSHQHLPHKAVSVSTDPSHHHQHSNHSADVKEPPSGLNPRALTFAVLSLIVAALSIAGTATPLLKQDSRPLNATLELTLWQTCREGPSTHVCTQIDDTVSEHCKVSIVYALRAFAILSILAAVILCIPAAIADWRGRLPMHHTRWLLLGAAIFLSLFTLVYWLTFIGLYYDTCDGGSAFADTSGAKWGPSPILFIVAFVFALSMIPVGACLPAPRLHLPHVSPAPQEAHRIRGHSEHGGSTTAANSTIARSRSSSTIAAAARTTGCAPEGAAQPPPSRDAAAEPTTVVV